MGLGAVDVPLSLVELPVHDETRLNDHLWVIHEARIAELHVAKAAAR